MNEAEKEHYRFQVAQLQKDGRWGKTWRDPDTGEWHGLDVLERRCPECCRLRDSKDDPCHDCDEVRITTPQVDPQK